MITNDMKRFLVLLLLLTPTAAFAQAEHSIWSKKPVMVIDSHSGAKYTTFLKGNADIAWTEGSTFAYLRAVAVVNANLTYEFRFFAPISASTASEFSGKFDIFRNGINVCHFCVGKAYLLNQPAGAGKAFKLYVGTPTMYAEEWHYSGVITQRFDY